MIIMKVVITGGSHGCGVECYPDIVSEPLKIEEFMHTNIVHVVHEAARAIAVYIAQQNPDNPMQIIDLDEPDSFLRDGLIKRIQRRDEDDNDDA